MYQKLERLENEAVYKIENAQNKDELESLRIKYLGRHGELAEIFDAFKNLSVEEKKTIGPKVNAVKQLLEIAFNKKHASFNNDEERIDVTKPGIVGSTGHINPLTIVDREIRRIFTSMNFSVVEGPEVESDYYNFTALNIPENHPARDMWDTFWLEERNMLLRTHTSPVQVHYMEAHEPPFQILVPGRVFRYEATDATHETNFHQVEGLVVGKKISLANFKYTISEFIKQFFNSSSIGIRFRPSYFPFVEPGVEIDIKWGSKWLEVMGAGMVHKNVFKAAHYNPGEWQGFAFGGGIERLAMIKYDIPDVRLFHSGDLRFIHQF